MQCLWLTRLGIVFCALMIASNCASGQAVPRARAIEIAKGEALALGYKLENMTVEADDGNKAWVEYLRLFETHEPQALKEPEFIELRKRLQGKQYWAVRFRQKEVPGSDAFDGGLWVFVERNSGMVIARMR